MSLSDAQAFVFDVFGTCVDWRTSVVKELEHFIKTTPAPDYVALANRWRQEYYISVRTYAESQPDVFPDLDSIHRTILDSILAEENIDLDEASRVELNLCWHRLSPWPDTNAGLEKLSSFAITSTLSNGNVRLLLDMKKYGGMPFDMIMSAELFQAYKPNPKAYLGAAEMLKLKPEQVCMVAAHPYDLQAAKKYGLKTAYVCRPSEDPKKQLDFVDINADSFVQLAELVLEQKKERE
ncbi:HAD-like domain-containing protein [Zychaea mexicana]|uniref:HAD-like domain-containing protein n=1 Tax=Zychaea mexicana TaxID=64656 RepID=UPI0022FF21B2|nr:HAD-like domain-containing protein [Zychaea mexicana]KAI9493350.1 HAD-like domain-containing protein [Zychaea mexicana]